MVGKLDFLVRNSCLKVQGSSFLWLDFVVYSNVVHTLGDSGPACGEKILVSSES
jgi:hypothetical protein